MRRRTGNPGYQYIILTFVLLLALFGVVLVFSSSASVAMMKNRDVISYARKQLLSLSIGLAILLACWAVDYMKILRLSRILMVGTFVLLIAVLFIPSAANVNRSIRILGFSIIPSEFAKLTIILYLAATFARKQDQMGSFWRGPFFQLLVLGAACLLVFVQPSHTNAIFLGLMGLVLWFYAGAPKKHLVPLVVVFGLVSAFFIAQHEYAMGRIDKFVQAVLNPLSPTSHHHSLQSTMSVINGGLFGVGLGNSEHALLYLPEPHTDFIWAILCEELGFVSSSVVLLLYF
nr:FtsW/RodA/SpoVE family cell cycle protein [bacterium]